MGLKGKSILRIRDLNAKEIMELVDSTIAIKKAPANKVYPNTKGKKAVCFFSKSSSRTKSSWEVGTYELGMQSSFNDASSSQLGKKESFEDSGQVFSQYYDIIGWRCMKYEDIKNLADHSDIPVINLLCNKNHPTQIICDIATIKTHFKKIKGIKVAFVGACNNNVARSLIEAVVSLGGEYIGIGPKKEFPEADELKFYQDLAKKNGGKVSFSSEIKDIKGANVIYQDVFLDLGESADLWPERLKMYTGYQVNDDLVKYADKNYIYMHCLPAINGSKSEYTEYVSKNFGSKFPWVKNGEVEVTASVFNSKHSVVFEQAQNRLHAMKAIIKAVL
ncbi:MAG: ornithine carbamoyltransferase [Mycoplasmoidaceae bacterium]|nr:MAG: ornithine carbamoyltransferase [Mycoplasmoidaceae bacterium]